MSSTIETIKLNYGQDGCFEIDLPRDEIRLVHYGPRSVDSVTEATQEALANPIEFPQVELAVIPDDRVVIALDAETPSANTVLDVLLRRLESAGVDIGQLTIVVSRDETTDEAPALLLSNEFKDRVQIACPDPADEDQFRYLASTAGGERIYLADPVIDADVLFTIGVIAFDPLLGYRGTNSVFYPGLSNQETIQKTRGQGHRELSPEDARPLRDTVDEIGWLLGTQFSLQVIPSDDQQPAMVLAGAADAVFNKGKELLTDAWRISLDRRSDTVVIAVRANEGEDPWQATAQALKLGRSLVSHEGRLVLLTQLKSQPGPGIRLLSQFGSPSDAVGHLRESAPDDMQDALQFADAADWARVYLLSELDADFVEGLHCIPLENEAEAVRLLSFETDVIFINSPRYTFAEILS
ncbi:lactate racemase domain-containing protein [Calycomorphotria hydatis]|uniref:LarA-like N-terminal domain-containing protein n=1 Tax=Calycomorphotria hydatis TaxID=2528027 RepID=A0A517T994_9PLAN|nr:lactate racemase domain-containing protein [Calycomorphotria hydatis]QDT64952.1 hypothetical protein V22_21980 [Calycomorphotria hydatis]